MARTKVFVSYSHQDREWLFILRRHLSILERQSLVHLWSDEKIRTGDYWEDEIETALNESAIAILLVTADFLGSSYVWNKEMPHIWKHMANGMRVLPVIARPCPWELERRLSQLQFFPQDGRPLSRGTPDEVDENLTRLTRLIYEVVSPLSDISVSEKVVGHWAGKYGVSTDLSLEITKLNKHEFTGRMTYGDTGTVTAVSGEVSSDSEPKVIFSETSYITKGSKDVDFEGKYVGILHSKRIEGRWEGTSGISDNFSLQRIEV
jgi:hypothetical protein